MADVSPLFQEGVAHHRAGRMAEAQQAYEQTLLANPRHAAALHLLGLMALDQNQLAKAIEYLGAAVGLEETQASAKLKLAEAYQRSGQPGPAIFWYREMLLADPRCQEALQELADLSHEQGNVRELASFCEQLLAANEDLDNVWQELGSCHYALGRMDRAVESFRRALVLNPRNVNAYNLMAVALNDWAKTEEALVVCQQGLSLDPNWAPLYSNMATALQHQGRIEEAIAARRRAAALAPDDGVDFENLLFSLNFSSQALPEEIYQEHLSWSSRHAESLTAAAAHLPPRQRGERRLRIGYVSSHFRNHAVNFFAEPILRSHDPQRFELFCYGDVADGGDEVTARLRSYADTWRDISGLSDEAAARLIREDQIDILVDLAGHIGGNRLLVFARRPAPIQVTYLGYQNTTGMTAMDYRLTDAWADPPGQTERYYTEQLVRLPRAFFCYQPMDSAPDVTPLPSLSRGYITFGSFNNYTKVSPQAVDAWLTILSRVPDSRLLVLANRGGYVEQRWQELAQARGIEPARIEVCDKRPYREYTQLIAQADIALDPFPFNGHTTTCDAIWMGVPVVMLQGPVYAQRFGASVHRNVGLEDWIATSVDEYIDKAVYFASQREELARLRIQLRPRMAASPLLDYAGFTRNLEAAYTTMWQRYREGVPRGTTWPT